MDSWHIVLYVCIACVFVCVCVRDFFKMFIAFATITGIGEIKMYIFKKKPFV